MLFSCTEYAAVGLPVWPVGQSTIIQEMCLSCTDYAVVGFPVRTYRKVYSHPRDSYVSRHQVSSMHLLVSWSLAYRTLYNHPMDEFFCTEYAVVDPLVVGLSDGL